MAMAGAMGSVGGDFSVLSINPAGIGLYRASEFSFSTFLLIPVNKHHVRPGNILCLEILPYRHDKRGQVPLLSVKTVN